MPILQTTSNDDYNRATREVFLLYQETGSLARESALCRRYLITMKKCVADITAIAISSRTMPLGNGENNAKKALKKLMQSGSEQIKKRLVEMIDEYDDLGQSCKLVTDAASMLVESVSNLFSSIHSVKHFHSISSLVT